MLLGATEQWHWPGSSSSSLLPACLGQCKPPCVPARVPTAPSTGPALARSPPPLRHLAGQGTMRGCGRLARTRLRCAASSPSLAMKGAPRCHLPPAPLPSSSLWHQDLTPLAPRWAFPCNQAWQLPMRPAALPPMLWALPSPPGMAGKVAQTKPLLVPSLLAATLTPVQGGDMLWPSTAWALPLPVPNKRVWWLWAGCTPSCCLQSSPATLLLAPGQGLSPGPWALHPSHARHTPWGSPCWPC